jgi:hypothetical protein
MATTTPSLAHFNGTMEPEVSRMKPLRSMMDDKEVNLSFVTLDVNIC